MFWYSCQLRTLQRNSVMKSLTKCILSFIVEEPPVQAGKGICQSSVRAETQFKLLFPVLLYIEYIISLGFLIIFPYVTYVFTMCFVAAMYKYSQGLSFYNMYICLRELPESCRYAFICTPGVWIQNHIRYKIRFIFCRLCKMLLLVGYEEGFMYSS